MTAGRPASPALVIHSLDDARLALDAVGRAGRAWDGEVTLLSAPDAACFMGAAWWRAMIDAAAPLHPAVRRRDLLDCGGAAGRAAEALRLGQRGLILSLGCTQRAAVLERADALGAIVLPSRPAALDLAAPYARRTLDRWLRDRPGDAGG